MSQEYTEDKDVSLTPLSSGQRLLEALLILVALFAVYLMVSLVSFNPSDPSWSQTAWHEPIHNLGGRPGAWLADTLFFIFGVMAYAIPVVIIGLCWISFRHRNRNEYIDCFAIGLRLIGVLALVVTTCGLAAINADDIWYFASGGVIGSLVSSAMAPYLNQMTGTLVLLFVWAAGITLYTGWSWLTIAEKIGGAVMTVLTFASNRSRGDDRWQYEDEDDAPESVSRKETSQEVTEDDPLFRSTDAAANEPSAHGNTAHPSENEEHDPLFSTPVSAPKTDDNDPLLSPSTFASVTAEDDNDPLFSAPAFGTAPETAAPVTPQPASVQSGVPENRPTPVVAADAYRAPAQVKTTQAAEPPLYRFDVPETVASQPTPEAPPSPASRASGVAPQVQTSRSDPQTSSAAVPQTRVAAATPAAVNAQTVAATVVKPAGQSPFAVAASMGKLQTPPTVTEPVQRSGNPQVKRGIGGPELPRPNPVRLPTRREMASYGIKLPSQRIAEEKAREEELQRQLNSQMTETSESSAEENEFDQAALRQAFTMQQKARYGEDHVTVTPEEEDELQQAMLARQFSEQQQQRYQTTAEDVTEVSADHVATSAPLSSEAISAFDFSPMKELVDDNPAEPLFTIAPGAETAAPAQSPSSVAGINSAQHSQTQGATAQPGQPQYAAQQAPAQSPSSASGVNSAQYSQPQGATAQPGQPQYAAQQAPAQSPSSAAGVNSAQYSQPQGATAQPGQPQYAAPQETVSQPQAAQEQQSLFHPFLVRHEQPLEKPSTPLPTMDLLTPPPVEEEPVDMFALEQTGKLVEARLNDFRVKAEVVGISPGPVITRFELDLAPGVKAARISNLSRDLARSLSAVAVRIVEVIPGKPYVGLELPNKHRQTVYLREVLDCAKFRDNPSPLAIVLGKDIAGQPVVADLAKMPHLLVAGTTGSGKSVGVNAMIISMLYKATPDEVRFIMIDPKMLELSVYEGIPHLLTEVVTDMKDAANALRWSVGEMERRYKLMSALGVRNLAGYNEKIVQAEAMGRPIPDPFWKPGDSMDTTPPVLEKLPYIVVLVDEFADLMMAVGKKVEELIARLAQKARAAGIHLVLATQRPSVDVITGLIKANIPTRIAFTVSSKIDSRTILDQAGAESLLGMGDMLYMPPNSSMPVRVHGAFVRDQEVHAVVQDWKARGRPQYIDSITAGDESENGAGGADGNGEELDPLFDQAVGFVVEKRRASISGVQRQFRIGYNRAARIIEQMEAQGIVSEPGHNGNREVLSPPPHEM